MTSNEEINKRIERLREKLIAENVEAILIKKRENIFYLSGYKGDDAILLISGNDLSLITDSRYEEQASFEAPLFNLSVLKIKLIDDSAAQSIRMGIKRLGFIKSELTYDEFSEFSSKLSGKAELIPVRDIVSDLRTIKTPYETEKIKNAVKIADDAFIHILKFIKPGISESDVSIEIEYHMKKTGASGASFETVVASGVRSSLPHGVASPKKIEIGDAITLDFGSVVDKYCSDMTRTVFLGNPSDEMKKIYKIVYKAQMEAENSAFEGLTGKEIDSVARHVIDESNYKGKFGHALGHGVGLEVHEQPRLSLSGNKTMKNGMIVTVEPGIYLKGIGGVRIEDMIVINGQNPIILTGTTKEMIVL
ncbi:MAG: aminopeptidase P family protein [Clostridia bacterium]|jgi:Xaa-Pro aminopeptidase